MPLVKIRTLATARPVSCPSCQADDTAWARDVLVITDSAIDVESVQVTCLLCRHLAYHPVGTIT